MQLTVADPLALHVPGEPVQHHEGGPGVVLELGALAGVGGVLESQRMEAEAPRQPVEVFRLGSAVHPDDGPRRGQFAPAGPHHVSLETQDA